MLSRGLSYAESAFRRQDVWLLESLALIELFEVSVTDLVTELCQAICKASLCVMGLTEGWVGM